MVEAPRIRFFCETIEKFESRRIIGACGTSYNKLNINLIDSIIVNIWFCGKNLFLYLKGAKKSYLIKIHFMMYGRVVVDGNHPKPHIKIPNFQLTLEKNNVLSWYFSQIKLVDKSYLKLSNKMVYFDVSHSLFDSVKLLKHVRTTINQIDPTLIVVDFLLDQNVFPGVGNILQQEALYTCRILPLRKVYTLSKKDFVCLINALHNLAISLYKLDVANTSYYERHLILKIYHKSRCEFDHKTITKYLGTRERRTTWCPICQI